MRNRRMSIEHQEAAAWRLSQLSDQLEASRSPAVTPTDGVAETVAETGVETGVDGTGTARTAGGADAPWWDDHTRPHLPVLSLVPAQDRPIGPIKPGEPDPVREPEPEPVPGEVPGELLPHPGRHASRRPGGPGAPGGSDPHGRAAGPWDGWGDLVPETLRGRIGLGPSQIAVVAVLVAVGALLTAWLVVRADPQDPVPVAAGQQSATLGESLVPADPTGPADPVLPAVASSADPADGDPAAAGASGAAGVVIVDVAGKVRRPGIVELGAGARVVDALEQAGGARRGVDLTSLNLARVLVDGEQIVVGAPGGAAPAPAPVPGAVGGTTASTGGATALVDLNLATQAELEELPDVGPVTATSIITWRETNGAFTAVTELLEVDGIGDVTLSRLAPLVTV